MSGPAAGTSDAAPSATATPFRAWLTVALLVVLGIIAFLDRQIISLLIGPIKQDLALSDTQFSLLQGFSFALLYATCAIPIGYAVDRYSRRLVIFAGVLIWALAASASGLMTTFGGLLVARVLVGMGEAALAPASYSILSDLFDRKRLALAISIYSFGSTLGASLALMMGGLLVAAVGTGLDLPLVGLLKPWQSTLFLTGLPGLAFCFLIFAIPEPARSRAPGAGIEGDAGWKALFAFMGRHRAFFACHLTGFACLMATAYALMSWLPAILLRSFGWRIADVGFALGLFSAITGISGLLLNGSIVDRMFSRGITDAHLRYYLWMAGVMAGFVLLAAATTSALVFLTIMIVPMLLNNFAGAGAASIQIVTPTQLRGKMSALYLMIISLFGLIVGPSSVALISDNIVGTDRVALALAIVFVVLMPVVIVSFRLGLAPMRRAVAEQS